MHPVYATETRDLHPRRAPLFPGTYSTLIRGTTALSTNDVYSGEVICFCDIPVEDFEVHMQKYSRFGVSFPKSFLASRDANPVFYIAKDALDRYPNFYGRRLGKSEITRAESFDAFFDAYRALFNNLFKWVSRTDSYRKDVPEQLIGVLEEVMTARPFLDDVFSHFQILR